MGNTFTGKCRQMHALYETLTHLVGKDSPPSPHGVNSHSPDISTSESSPAAAAAAAAAGLASSSAMVAEYEK